MITLHAGDTTLLLDEMRGARISSMRIGERPIILGPPDDTDVGIRWGSYLMAPWAGRIPGGLLDWEGTSYQLPQRDGPNAIHGLVYERRWRVVDATATTVELTTSLAEAGWPFGGDVRQRLDLRADSLTTRVWLRTDRRSPLIVGWHPWFLRNDDTRVTVNGAETLETLDLIPTGKRLPVDTVTDLRAGPSLGGRQLDTFYPDVSSPATIRWRDLELSIEFDSPFETVIVFSGEPATVCVEPQTGWPNAAALAFAGVNGTGLITLDPGEEFEGSMTWRWRSLEDR